MKYLYSVVFILTVIVLYMGCESEKESVDYSGTYCLNIQNLEMTLMHTDNGITFTLQNDLLVNGTGNLTGDTLILTAQTMEAGLFSGKLIFSEDMQSFSGPYQITDINYNISSSGILVGNKGVCSKYDIDSKGIPGFIEEDFTQLSKIERISKFRSGFGHSYTDGTEECRSMKHYFMPYANYRENNTIEIYSPVTGTIISVSNDGHGASPGLKNKLIQIKPDDQPAFVFELFHCDLISSAITAGKKVEAGELLAFARLFYEDLEEHANSFDIALWVNTPSGMRLIPYFDALTDVVFNHYISRGANTRQDFIISPEARNADPLICNGETFLNEGNLENWFALN